MDVLFAGTSSHIGKWRLEDIVKGTSKRKAGRICFLQGGGLTCMCVCECVLLATYNNVLTPCHVRRCLIKCEKLIVGRRSTGFSLQELADFSGLLQTHEEAEGEREPFHLPHHPHSLH